jgi:hypothetical protein
MDVPIGSFVDYRVVLHLQGSRTGHDNACLGFGRHAYLGTEVFGASGVRFIPRSLKHFGWLAFFSC